MLHDNDDNDDDDSDDDDNDDDDNNDDDVDLRLLTLAVVAFSALPRMTDRFIRKTVTAYAKRATRGSV